MAISGTDRLLWHRCASFWRRYGLPGWDFRIPAPCGNSGPASDMSFRPDSRNYFLVPREQRLRGIRSHEINSSPRKGVLAGPNIAIHPRFVAFPNFRIRKCMPTKPPSILNFSSFRSNLSHAQEKSSYNEEDQAKEAGTIGMLSIE